ncbi:MULTISPECIES: pyrimidine/purine nucleoside phosphorylase [unclassified Pseudohongiella]|uniref:pyrimidine/purine nucleoside phosphorylase n=1 Tax=unclassified Pseudohongiella TaxID=2629611 RepID=UPI002697E34D|nr:MULTISPECIES: pyrimidine/purine nucleoside phosphorylase [unclassified Pseudohongiella]|tara:strand:- start:1833 stop:2150 length:318 start_codon:yes stop_codon:yes gene_type:complete
MMSKFENVTVVKAANIYFDGNVTSRIVEFANGDIKTLGIMMPGDYRFGTEKKEIMEIQAGEVEVLLPGEDLWRKVGAGDSFEVPANSAFDIKVLSVTDYCCSYLG